MAIGSGLAAQAGFVAETTWGTPLTVTTFVPLISESMGMDIERLESKAILANKQFMTSEQWSGGRRTVGGDVQLELPTVNVGTILHHMMGTSSGSSTRTYTPGNLTGKGMTWQIGVPDVSGTVRPKSYEGCKIASWEIGCSAGEIATLGLSLIAEDETVATGLAAASYITGAAIPFTFIGATATMAGVTTSVSKVTVSGDNKLERRFFQGSALTSEPIQTALTEVSGSLEIEFANNYTDYNRFVNGTETALVLNFVSGAKSLQMTMNVRYDGETPKVGGPGIVAQNLPFKALSTAAGADSTALTIVQVV